MAQRRSFLTTGVGLVAGALGGARAADAQTAVSADISVQQSDFLFWMADDVRANARQAAEAMTRVLDASPPEDPSAARRLYAAGGRELHQRFRADDFANRVAQARGALGRLRRRAFQGVDGGFRMLPNIPDGEYCIVCFDIL